MKKDTKKIDSVLYEKGGKFYCKEKCIIEFPKWYMDKDMCHMEENTTFYGVAAIVVGDSYSVMTIPTMCSSDPIDIKEVEKDGEDYLQLHFGKDDPILSAGVISDPLRAYNFIETFFLRAKVPWYIDYLTLYRCLINLLKYGGSDVGKSSIANELITSFIARSALDPNIFYRQVGSKGDMVWVDLMNVYYSVRSTATKLAGGYFKPALTSALVQKNTQSSKLEEIVRR